MNNQPAFTPAIRTGILAFFCSVATLTLVNLGCEFFEVYLSLPLLLTLSLLAAAGAGVIAQLRQDVLRLQRQVSYLMEQLDKLEKETGIL